MTWQCHGRYNMAETTRGNWERAGAMIVVATALLAIGVVMVASTSVSLDRTLFEPSMWRTPFSAS